MFDGTSGAFGGTGKDVSSARGLGDRRGLVEMGGGGAEEFGKGAGIAGSAVLADGCVVVLAMS